MAPSSPFVVSPHSLCPPPVPYLSPMRASKFRSCLLATLQASPVGSHLKPDGRHQGQILGSGSQDQTQLWSAPPLLPRVQLIFDVRPQFSHQYTGSHNRTTLQHGSVQNVGEPTVPQEPWVHCVLWSLQALGLHPLQAMFLSLGPSAAHARAQSLGHSAHCFSRLPGPRAMRNNLMFS